MNPRVSQQVGLCLEIDFLMEKETIVKNALMQNCDYLRVYTWLMHKDYVLLHQFVTNVLRHKDKISLELQKKHVDELFIDCYAAFIHLPHLQDRRQILEVMLGSIKDATLRGILLQQYWARYVCCILTHH